MIENLAANSVLCKDDHPYRYIYIFIDDGVGIHTMTKRVFNGWKKEVSKRVATFGLKIKDLEEAKKTIGIIFR